MNQWMCELCFPKTKEVGIVAPGYSLIYNENKYHILGGQGHKGHEIVTFEEMPWPDPDPTCADDLTPEQNELAECWLDQAIRFDEKLVMRASETFAFLSACEKTGWDKGSFGFWLFDRAGRLIARDNGWGNQGLDAENDEIPESFWNYRVMVRSHRR